MSTILALMGLAILAYLGTLLFALADRRLHERRARVTRLREYQRLEAKRRTR